MNFERTAPPGRMVGAEVPAADFVRRFGVWRDRAKDTPVFVTNHGRPTHVLLGIDRFDALNRTDHPRSEMDPVDRSVIEAFDKVRECVFIVDADLRILRANMAACSFLARPVHDVVGAPLNAVVPKLSESFVERNIKRTLTTGEHLAADVRSLTRDGVWLHVESVRVPAGVAVKFRDITEDVEAHRVADVKKCMIRAMEVDGSIGYARISPRGMIERADRVLTDLVGLSAENIQRVSICTMVLPARREEFRDKLEQVFETVDTLGFESCLLTSSGGELPVRISMVALRGEYACDGAVALIRPRD